MATNTPSKSASERAALVGESRLEARYLRKRDMPGTAALIDRLADALEAADADTQRLDWLENTERELVIDLDAGDVRWAYITGFSHDDRHVPIEDAPTLREAIDAARAAEETGR